MMRHFIFVCAVFAGPVATRPLRMFEPAATARLVTPPCSMQRSATRVRRTIGAVDVAPVAIAANHHLSAAARLGAQKKPGSHRLIGVAATSALVMPRLMLWTRAAVTAMMPLQSCLCTVWGTAPKQNCQVMGRRRACLPISAGSIARTSNTRRSDPARKPTLGIVQVGPQGPPAPSLRCAQRALRSGGGSLLWTTWTIHNAAAKVARHAALRYKNTDSGRHSQARGQSSSMSLSTTCVSPSTSISSVIFALRFWSP